ncbi:MAG TPA: enoyl-CoA hydratase-related protein [Syntrophorhabdales bacterium]|nr:enoyl-CoA hydratase-related protein [Syntrophorhabdales bacterium]
MPYENIILELEGPIAIIKFNRPKALNALNSATLDELKQVGSEVALAKEIRVVIVTGAGEKAFVAGADIQEMKDMTPVQASAFSHKGHAALGILENMRKPVIAAVNGYALGGGFEVALACDIIYASEKARLGFPEVTLGVFPGFGGTQRTARLIGAAKAKELVLSGKVITAQEGFKMGLLNKVTAPDQLMAEARELAAKFLAAGPVGIGLAKYLVNKSLSLNIDSGLELEANTFGLCFGTQDQKEGMTAFVEKRTPTFQGE